MVTKKPNLFIVGAPKCGTSFLYEYLSLHPEVYMCPVKEPNFFDKDLTYTSQRLSVSQYLELFKKSSDQKIIGEASPFYLYSTVACSEIYKFNPEAKIIIMLRNPVDMLYSLHGEHLYQGNEVEENFEKALDLEELRKKGREVHKHTNPKEGVYYKEIASYTSQVKRYFDLVGRERVLVILFDDLKSQPEEVYKVVLKFLHITDTLSIDLKVVNPQKEIKSKSFRELVNRPPAFLKGLIRILIPIHSFRTFIQKKLSVLNSKKAKRIPIDPTLANRLKKEMTAEVEALGELLGKDLTRWVK